VEKWKYVGGNEENLNLNYHKNSFFLLWLYWPSSGSFFIRFEYEQVFNIFFDNNNGI
jgi:hypothetical protein